MSWPLEPSKISTANETWQLQLFLFTSSYFIFDLIYCLYMQTEENYMILHHLLGMIVGLYGVYYDACGYECALGFWITELANPFLQIRWFLRSMEWHSYLPYKVNEGLFVVVFLFNRVVLGSVYFYVTLFVSNAFLAVKISTVFVHMFNFFFAHQIVGLVIRRYKE